MAECKLITPGWVQDVVFRAELGPRSSSKDQVSRLERRRRPRR